MTRPFPRGATLRMTRRRLIAAVVGLTAVVGTTTAAPTPAGATPAPLVTEDGLGIRVDETAILGPALEAIESEMQPFVDDMIRDGAIDGAPVSGYHALYTSGNLELGFDFLAPSTGRPAGGLTIHADIEDIELEYRRDAWWHSDCGIWVRPSDATIDISASVAPNLLPAAPIALDPVQATWDDDPDVSTSGACWTYLIDDYWNAFVEFFSGDDPESTASRIEALLNAEAGQLVEQIWTENVVPVLESVSAFGVSVGQLRADDHGLIVTADLDATGGLTLPGMGGPFDVSSAQDAGVTTNVNTLLANRSTSAGPSDAIVSIHPNVVNQFMVALHTLLNGAMGNPAVPVSQAAALEAALLPPAARDTYPDDRWVVGFRISAPASTAPTGTGGAPEMTLPQLTLQFLNTNPRVPVATFTGSMSDIQLDTVVRDVVGNWGPKLDASGASLSVTRTQANAHAAAWTQTSADIEPFARFAFANFDSSTLTQYVTIAPLSIGGLPVQVCGTCPRYSGDQRYTETINVG